MSRFFAGILTGIAGLMGGGWLIAAPFAPGFQRSNTAWIDATKVDMFTGAGIMALGLLTLVGFAAGLVATLRAEGALAQRQRGHAEPEEPPEETRASVELQSLVARLALALEDHERQQDGDARTAGQPSAQARRAG
jgi:hypothetical protein